MTVAIPEASTAVRTRAASRAPARQSRPTPAQMGRPGPRGYAGGQGPRGPSARERPVREPPAGRERPQERQKRPESKSRRTGPASRPALHNYQAIIAAEYIGATLLVAISPIATRKAQLNPTSGKLSPYLPQDIIKLFAIGITYLILEGLAAGPRGLARFSAWFGALIFLAVGLSELSNIAQIFNTISGGAVNPVKLTGAQAPAVKGDATIPPLGQGPPSKTPGGP